MSKAKETAGKTAKTGAATRKGNTNRGNGRRRVDYSAYKLPPPPKGAVLVPTVAADKLRKRIGGDAYAMLEKIAKAMNGVSWTENDNTPVSLYREFLLAHRKDPAGWARSIALRIDTGALQFSKVDMARRAELRKAFVSAGLDAELDIAAVAAWEKRKKLLPISVLRATAQTEGKGDATRKGDTPRNSHGAIEARGGRGGGVDAAYELANALEAKGIEAMQAFVNFVENRDILRKHGIKFRITFGWDGKAFCDLKQGEAILYY